MSLSEYFRTRKGFGVLATTDAAGQINQAVYDKPYFLTEGDEATCSFLMTRRLTHDNVWQNPSASYAFIEEGGEFNGKRLTLTVISEETDPERIRQVRRQHAPPIAEDESHYLVHFRINGVRPLVGAEGGTSGYWRPEPTAGS